MTDAPQEPKLPFPEQHQDRPSLESDLTPAPRYEAEHYRPAGKLEGRVALITGGDSGIGRAVAVMYAREGAKIAINYLREEEPDTLETQAAVERHGGECLLLPADITESKTCTSLVERTVRKFGRLDILVSNAAHQARKQALEDLIDEELDRTVRTNLYALVWLSRAALHYLRSGGCILATSSETGILGAKNLPDYAATKGAINAFVKSLAQLLIPRGIRVNAVAPAYAGARGRKRVS